MVYVVAVDGKMTRTQPLIVGQVPSQNYLEVSEKYIKENF